MNNKEEIKYLTDASGKKTAVVIPMNKWKSMSENRSEFEEYISIKKSLKQGFKEAGQIASRKIKGKSLSSFLNDL